MGGRFLIASLLALTVGYFMSKKDAASSSSTFGARTIKRSGDNFWMFAAQWCHFCKEAKPEFDKVVGQHTVNGRTVNFQIVDVDKEKAMTQEYGVEGFPTFILEVDGKRVKYDGPRTKEAFLDYVQKNV